jgi:hypothetical protein
MDAASVMIDESNFRESSIYPFQHHFLCNLCQYVVTDPKQCSSKNCQVLFCGKCVTSKGGSWQCPICREKKSPEDLHRKLKDFLLYLKFMCPGCSEALMYNQMLIHLS